MTYVDIRYRMLFSYFKLRWQYIENAIKRPEIKFLNSKECSGWLVQAFKKPDIGNDKPTPVNAESCKK